MTATLQSVASLLVLALGLAMDATAVAAARGLGAREVRARDALLVAALFGGAQAAMPLLGWLVGARVGAAAASWDHFIAAALLLGIGVHMILEARAAPEPVEASRAFALSALLPLSIATSVDALAAGAALPMLGLPPVVSAATIGVVTGILAGAGAHAGRRFGARLGRRLDVVGGCALIALAAKVLLDSVLA